MTDYDTSYPPSLWGGGTPAPVPATGATAGIPGTWTPPGSQAPADPASLQGGIPNAVVASPTTGWTTGQFVQTRLAGAAGRATWTGTGWVGGVAVFSPNGQTIEAVKTWVESLTDDVQAETQRVLDIERENANRSTLVSWLDQRLGIELTQAETENDE